MKIELIQKPTDPICTRASIGGSPEIGFYCIFRGDKPQVIECLEAILKGLKDNLPVKQEEMHGLNIVFPS